MDERTGALVADLVAARDEFLGALHAFSPTDLVGPRLLGEWSARELVAHLGYWSGHAVEVIQAAERGATDSFGEGRPSVEVINETVARVARGTDLVTAQAREHSAFEVLVERLTSVDPRLLELRLPDGATVEQELREDGADHYREHAADLRRATAR